MNYYELSCPKPDKEELTEILIAELADRGFESFQETATFLMAYAAENDFDKSVIDQIEYCRNMQEKGQLELKLIPDQNWNAVWESNYPPVLIANRCYIRAPFHEEKKEIEFNILINPKMAFGTAHHETTAQIIELMLEEDFHEQEVLDMGCGTGVLAILASMKGAKHVDAIDIDSWSFNNTTENMEINYIQNISPILGDAHFLNRAEQYDSILANINRNILLDDMKFYTKALKPGGKIFFSGFYEVDLPIIQNKAKSLGLVYQLHHSKNDWVAAVFRRKQKYLSVDLKKTSVKPEIQRKILVQ